ncbi:MULTISPECIES: ABC transporter substrate-binding protein [unclassified Streptomyces]|uniref:ABC transporter substrate-binding protein n=1 Tax=unclassified Streptomyces TaxID=2593676 RepID=UPI000C27A608|nr:ABC transporter substrate-binding protein [Streptomyces sp. CB02959]PJN36522.1 ABC transporter substrate-binding protein [Streptomyces sp. CB02959]
MKRDQWLAAPIRAGLATALLAVAGCGTDTSESSGHGEPVVMGMTDKVVSTDPASGYDPGSWLLFNNVFQSLLSFPKGGTTPEPEAAESCGFTGSDSKVYRCTLKDGLTFSNGDKLTSQDVKFSFDRIRSIKDKNGPAVMFAALDNVETPDARTVVFHLKTPDATFPMKIASGAGSIVDHTAYPADRLRTDGKAVGSGVYALDSYSPQQAKFSVNTSYKGPAKAKNSGMTLKFYGNRDQLKQAVQSGGVDVAYRGLAMKDIAALDRASLNQQHGTQVVEGGSAEVMHLVFNLKDPVAGKLGVRKAVAYLLDRSTLVRDVYQRTAEPLYSVVPAGITGHNTAFFSTYGDRPQPDKATAAVRDAGIPGKVPLTLWATPDRFGPGTVAAVQEIATQLNASGLFDAKVRSVPTKEYDEGMAAGRFGVYVKGWIPDYPDPDNFTQPFFGKDSVLANHYSSPEITGRLLPATSDQPNRGATKAAFRELQDIVAKDLPVIPIWQGKQYAVARQGVSGLEWTLDSSTVFRFWEISKSADA